MYGLILLGIIAAVLVFAMVAGKGFRTTIMGYATVGFGAVVPLLTEMIGYLQTLDWRTYVLTWDKKNLTVLAIVGGLGLAMIVLRHFTTGPVGTDE